MWLHHIKCFSFPFDVQSRCGVAARNTMEKQEVVRHTGICGSNFLDIYELNGFMTVEQMDIAIRSTVYPKKYAHGFVVLCFFVVTQSFIMNPHEVFIHIHQGCFAGTGAIVRLPQCQWSKPDGCGKISQCITTTKHSKAKTVCIFLWIYYR